MKLLKRILLWVMTPIVWILVPIVGTIGIFIGTAIIQEKIFVPKEYIMWLVNSPATNLIFIYELMIIGAIFFFWDRQLWRNRKASKRQKRHSFFSRKKSIISIFVAGNVVFLYTIMTAVTVITNDKIIVHSFLSPQGKEYSYNDIVQIETGVYGKRKLFEAYKGDFFYKIEFADGQKVDLTNMGGASGDTGDLDNEIHEFFIIEDLDEIFVEMQIPKEASMENYIYSTENLDPIYTDAIRTILENRNEEE